MACQSRASEKLAGRCYPRKRMPAGAWPVAASRAQLLPSQPPAERIHRWATAGAGAGSDRRMVGALCTARCQKGSRGRPSIVADAASRPSTASQSQAKRSAAAACSRSLEARMWVLSAHHWMLEEERPACALASR